MYLHKLVVALGIAAVEREVGAFRSHLLGVPRHTHRTLVGTLGGIDSGDGGAREQTGFQHTALKDVHIVVDAQAYLVFVGGVTIGQVGIGERQYAVSRRLCRGVHIAVFLPLCLTHQATQDFERHMTAADRYA